MSDVRDSAADRLTRLATLGRRELAIDWAAEFGTPAPRHAQVPFLRGALAWRCQVAHEAAGEVEQLIRHLRRQAASQNPVAVLTPGTRLLRDWQGQTHYVTVVTNGFEYNARIYKSLTAIARQITCTAWSGPLFFGLRK